MNILSVSGLSKSYGDKVLFNGISFGISRGDKVALVARNGAGKSTLFRILKGIEIPDEGECVFRRDVRISFLDQDQEFDPDSTVWQIVYKSDNPVLDCIRRYEDLIGKAESDSSADLATRLEESVHEMNNLNAWEFEKNIREILGKLGIGDLSRVISTLSGGEKKRVALAITLISNPDILFMDEPTNHLDIEMIEWLEYYLSGRDLSLLLVTHDRYFLNKVCDRVLELDDRTLHEYEGDFEYYLEKKSEREAARASEIEKARNLYYRELEWIRKMPKARGTKSKARVDAFDGIKAKAFGKKPEQKLELRVRTERLGSKILELHRVTKSFGEKLIMNPFSYTFKQGEKVGIIGRNGTGKSTFLKMLLDEVQPDTGKIQRGETVIFGHYAQGGISLAAGKRIIEVVRDVAEHIVLANGNSLSASQLLSRFNFPPAVQYNFADKLSGGEKRRLYLLTILMKNPNFLILDEPTNDLDIVTLQILEDFISEFQGCVIIVSHDRHFIDRLAEHTFVFEGNGEIRDFPGGYSDYRTWKEAQEMTTRTDGIQQKKNTEAATEKSAKSAGGKLSFKIQRELQQLETEIPALEERKISLETELSEGTSDYNEIKRLSALLHVLNEELEVKSLRWIELQEMLT
jgi:ATP-binding cassette subfamily F protein uup